MSSYFWRANWRYNLHSFFKQVFAVVCLLFWYFYAHKNDFSRNYGFFPSFLRSSDNFSFINRSLNPPRLILNDKNTKSKTIYFRITKSTVKWLVKLQRRVLQASVILCFCCVSVVIIMCVWSVLWYRVLCVLRA